MLLENVKYNFELRNLSIGYDKKILHSGIYCALCTGEILVILGRNGSGKSTLLRTIASLQKSVEGEVLIHGISAHQIARQEFSKVLGVVLTGNRQHTGMLSVDEIFALSRAPHTGWMHALQGEDKAIIDQAFNFFQLNAFRNRSLFSLSDGELQKVMVARAFVQQTEIIALDEPTSHLDIFNRAEIFNDLKTLAKEFDKTIIIATHEIEEGLQLADKVLLLDNTQHHAFGTKQEIIKKGEVQSFFSSPGFHFDETTLRFISTSN